MQILFALVAVLWWVALWGLIDLATEDWARAEKAQLYVGILLVVTLVILFFPRVLGRL
jgi:hypothetical protein